ncbi:hypothetical protein [Tissierella praeacuta]|uniref:hypothetical protein n=1 Tax=Tissierella praeacuta TaxID=43131 RepID=UPI0028A93EA0|nr:hypothetical protein [Tissierella praeacuta]
MNSEELKEFFLNKCGLALNHGEIFGEEGKLFQRFNIACPHTVLEKVLLRIEKAIKDEVL